MPRILPSLLVLSCLMPIALHAQFDMTIGRGFAPEKLYDGTDFDSVDLSTGALGASIPLGQRYVVSSHLSYQFVAHYTSRNWDWEKVASGGTTRPQAVPHHQSNAGLGWSLHFGVLLPPTVLPGPENPQNPDPVWKYVSEDGAVHRFHATLHDGEVDGDSSDNLVDYTRDNSYLRLTHVGHLHPEALRVREL